MTTESEVDTHVGTESNSDERMHDLERDCWCQPEIMRADAGVVVVHSRGDR